MKKIRNFEWQDYRHPEFLRSLNVSVNELKFIRLFLKRGTVALVNEILREQNIKQFNYHPNHETHRNLNREKIKT